jgi:hypothetical protein
MGNQDSVICPHGVTEGTGVLAPTSFHIHVYAEKDALCFSVKGFTQEYYIALFFT